MAPKDAKTKPLPRNNGHLTRLDYVFATGIILAPYTALRVWKFGPGELLLIAWMVIVYCRRMQESKSSFIDINNPITSYQVANLFMMMLGMFVGVLFYNERQTVTDAVTDIFSHLFMLLLASTIFNEYNRRDVLYINCLLEVIVTLGAVIHGSMLLYARFVNNTLFGKVLWLGNQTRFIGLAINPHQIGMIGGPGLFFALYLMSMTDNIWTKLRYILLAIVWFMVSDATKSDTMNAS